MSILEQKIARMSSQLAPLMEQPGRVGANARALIALLPAYARWFQSERAIGTKLCLEATATVAGNMLAMTIANLLDERDHQSATDAVMDYVRKTLTEAIEERPSVTS